MKPRSHVWEQYLGPAERALAEDYAPTTVHAAAPALLLVDLYNKAYGERREPIDVSRARYPSSCGEAAWDAIGPTQQLLHAARSARWTVAYSTAEDHPEARAGVATRRSRRSDDEWSLAIKAEFQPQEGELVVYKNAPSALFDTPLSAYLRRLRVDCVVVAGETTSGCVRATAVDAYSSGFSVVVVEDACFDRAPLSHAASLFDLHTKYARVAWADDVLAGIRPPDAPHALPALSL